MPILSSLDHAILRSLPARKITDEQVLWLIDLILQSGEGMLSEPYDMVYFPGDDLLAALQPSGQLDHRDQRSEGSAIRGKWGHRHPKPAVEVEAARQGSPRSGPSSR